ncbi:MAG: hypothetical protein V1912_07265 [bacterium]
MDATQRWRLRRSFLAALLVIALALAGAVVYGCRERVVERAIGKAAQSWQAGRESASRMTSPPC